MQHLVFVLLCIRLQASSEMPREHLCGHGDACDDTVSMLQLRTEHPRSKSSTNGAPDALSLGHIEQAGNMDALPWDLQSALADKPSGAYFKVMDPVLEANVLAYCASAGPDYKAECDNKTIDEEHNGGASWERLYELETSSMTTGGPHVLVFADHSNRRAIFAIRGACLEGSKYEQCNMDCCFMMAIKGFGDASELVYSSAGSDLSGSHCKLYDGKLNYVEQTEALIKRAQEQLPGYNFLATGHSMGGFLATIVSAKQPGVLKALTLAPSPYHPYMTEELGWSETEVEAMNVSDLIATCDPYDCGINSVFVANARMGGTTCLFKHTQEPSPCWPYLYPWQPYASDHWRGIKRFRPLAIQCKGATHVIDRYADIVHQRSPDNSNAPAYPPTCSTDFSVIQTLARVQPEKI